ncbi:MAG: mycothiol synthase, partial [Actinomycetota bacterium]|nr:mycothiol synthase [Actinomycetota bacterium]
HGRALLTAALRESPDGRLRLWAHGRRAPAAAWARSMGFEQMRELWQMRRALLAELPDAPLPPGVTVRPFVPGHDDEAWLALNRRAFAGHPEQGAWTAADLHRRMAEPWFDPAGFFLAERDGRLVGFHWTKVHAHDDQHEPHEPHEPIGEIYVLGVDPGESGGGLGRALAVIGLRELRARRLPEAMLYVEAGSTAAIRLYTSLGFTHWDTDTMFRRG